MSIRNELLEQILQEIIAAGGALSPEQEAAVDSIVNLPDGEVPKAIGGELVVSGQSVDPVDEEHTFDKSVNIPQASLNISDPLGISEATTELIIHDHISETNFTGVLSQIDNTGSQPLTWQFLGNKSTITPQPVFDTEFNTNPFIAPLLASATNQTDAVTFKTGAAMTNVRITITDNVSGLVLKYIPNKAAVRDGVGGLNFIVGDNRVDFNSTLPDVPASGLFYLGNTPLRQIVGQASTLEVEADSVSILGEIGGIPYIQNEIQFITSKNILPKDEMLSPDPRNFYFAKGGDDTKVGTTIENANETIQSCIDKVNALIPASDAANPSAIISEGFGVYNEDITVPEGCTIYAPKARLNAFSVAALTMLSDSVANFDSVTNAAFLSDGVLINNVNNVTINVRELVNGGTSSNAIHVAGTSTNVFINAQRIVSGATSGAGIFDGSTGPSSIVYNIGDMLLEGVGSGGILFNPTDASAQAIINIGAVRATAGTAIGVKVDSGIVTLTVNNLEAPTAIQNSSGSTLNVIASKTNGDIIINGTATVYSKILEHDGVLTISGTADMNGFIQNINFDPLLLVNGDMTVFGTFVGGL